MKRTFTAIVCTLLLVAVLAGCGSTNPFDAAAKTFSDEGMTITLGNEFVKMIFVSFLNSNIYPLKNLPTSRVCISLETPYSKASSHFPIASH